MHVPWDCMMPWGRVSGNFFLAIGGKIVYKINLLNGEFSKLGDGREWCVGPRAWNILASTAVT